MANPRGALRLLSLIIVSALFLTACAQNVVRLNNPSSQTVIAKTGAPSVCVVLFEDKRGKSEIGQRRNGDLFLPRSSVDDWVSRAMADALVRHGLVVTYAQDLEQAKQSNPNYIATGGIEEVWLKESSLTTLTCSMRATVSLLRGNGTHVFKNTFTASLSKRVIPGTDSAPDVLTETLGDIVQPAAQKIEQTAR